MKRFEDVHKFWFGDLSAPKPFWFNKDPEADRLIHEKFEPLLSEHTAKDLAAWKETPKGLVSLVVLLDQFPRNAFRDTPRMFAFDSQALEVAHEGLQRGDQDKLNVHECIFLFMPLEHSEDITDQRECVRLFEELEERVAPKHKALAKDSLQWAKRHMQIIEKFGRFPHRNQILGRTSTPEEIAFLKQPGSRF